MKKIVLLTFVFTSIISYSQTQIGNSDLESWENVASDQEPTNWNSFLTADGSLSGFGANQIEPSSDVRPGSSGVKSARIWSRDAAFGIIANGNMTLGRIHMGSVTATGSGNYNKSVISDPNFSEAFTDNPDSLVFWAKFNPISSSSNARVKATIHNNNEYRDPQDSASDGYVVDIAELNFPSTNGQWQRFSIPFENVGPATTRAFILVTFTTNETPGGGDADDELFIDDIELIYNPVAGLEEQTSQLDVWLNNNTNQLNVKGDYTEGSYQIYTTSGALVQSGNLENVIDFNQLPGVYFVRVQTNNGVSQYQIFKN